MEFNVVTQSTNCECQIALTLAIIELEPPNLSALLVDDPWSPYWFTHPSLPLWTNLQGVKYPQDSISEPKQNY
mgnify:CR=1 FL=1